MALGMITTAKRYKLLLCSVLLIGGFFWPELTIKTAAAAAARGNSSDCAGYKAYVIFRLNDTNPIVESEGTLSVWNPKVARAQDYSLGKVAAVRVDPQTQRVTASMEAGFIVAPSRYGDNTTRFYIRWMNVAANGTKTGCFDLDCEGFVPTTEGREYIGSGNGMTEGERITIIIEHDLSGKWYLYRDEDEMGTWSDSLFTGSLNAGEFGGEVCNSAGDTRPTSEMGNGLNPEKTNRTAADIDYASVLDNDYTLVDTNFFTPVAMLSNPSCYSANFRSQDFYYGGSGCSS